MIVKANLEDVKRFDPELHKALIAESKRQEEHLELIASENYASPQVKLLQACNFTNKYAEGYPGKRYYAGCENVDVAEELAQQRACKLFNCEYANVQPHSGSQANAAVYQALCKPLDTILGMSLDHGGHLTHGSKVNFSGKFYQPIQYGINAKSGLIDYEQVRKLSHEHKPKLIVAGFSAYSRNVDWSIFQKIAKEVGAYLLVDMAHVAGLIAVDEYPNPLPYADVVTTTTHKTLRGPRGGMILAQTKELAKKLNSAVFPGQQGGPLMHVIASKAIAFKEALEPKFKEYQIQVKANANAMATRFIELGYDIVSGGTDNHLFLVDLRKLPLSGLDAEQALTQANITLNKNTVPEDERSPFVTSGIRIGSPALTTRGFKTKDVIEVVNLIDAVIKDYTNSENIAKIRAKVIGICKNFPVP